ncbi:MAG: potassium transporter TrkG [Pseudomonadota bacterium]
MLFPAIFAARVENWEIARIFLYHFIFAVIITLMLGIAFSNHKLSRMTAHRLSDLFIGFLAVPLLLALPVQTMLPQYSYWDMYFEMLSALTTTGATVFTDLDAIPETVHLWRALIAWFGGFLMLVVALAVFQPARLGGFEVYGANDGGQSQMANYIRRSDIRARILRFTRQIFPLYFGLTVALMLLLALSGMRPFLALIYAMGVFSTSGISASNGTIPFDTTIFSELLIFCALLTATSRFVFQQDMEGTGLRNLRSDKEVNLMLLVVIIVPTLLFLRHFTAAIEVSAEEDLMAALRALWGSVFMVLSFLTTTGYESMHWQSAQNWSGLGVSATVLIGLSIMGGGIATTAGGLKLLRIYALYKHGLREMQRMSFPSSVMGAGKKARAIRREGAYIAWVFFMLFLVTLALLMLFYALTGLSFEESFLLAVSGLSTTGPLLTVVGDSGLNYAQISPAAKTIFAISMILGRLEILAVIAILSPATWGR